MQTFKTFGAAVLLTLPAFTQEPPDRDLLAAGEAEFAFELHRSLGGRGNLVHSPVSLYAALVATHAGARGATAAELERILHLEAWEPVRALSALAELAKHLSRTGEGDEEPRFAMANALWAKAGLGLRPEVAALLSGALTAELRGFDFGQDGEAARAAINAWCSEHTRGLVPELLKPGDLTPLSMLVLTNAVHFKAPWVHEFESSLTTARSFHLAGGETVEVPFMTGSESYGYAEVEGAVLIELAYELRGFALNLVVPREGTELATIERRLDADTWRTWTGALRPREVHLSMPKVRLRSSAGLVEALTALGAKTLFAASADLSGFAGEPGELRVDKVLQEAVLNLDEHGTEAAAATAVVMKLTSAIRPPEPPVRVVVDRPYLMVLRERVTGAVLFVARVADPR